MPSTPPTRQWPRTTGELIAAQSELADLAGEIVRRSAWRLHPGSLLTAGCFVAPARAGVLEEPAGEKAWAVAVTWRTTVASSPEQGKHRVGDRQLEGRTGSPRMARDVVEQAVVSGDLDFPYVAGCLAMRVGPLLSEVLSLLGCTPDVLLVDGTGRDHPRRAGLALHLGAVTGIPTVGVTNRPLVARHDQPEPERGKRTPLSVGDELVGYCVRTRTGARAVLAHAGWRTDPRTAAEVVMATSTGSARTPVPLQEARRAVREARAAGLAGRIVSF